MKRRSTLATAILFVCIFSHVRASDSQLPGMKLEIQISNNPDNLNVQVVIRRPSEFRVENLPVAGYRQEDTAKLKKYSEISACFAIEARLTLGPNDSALKHPYLQGISQVPNECNDLFSNGRYRYAAWNHDTDIFLGADGAIYTDCKGLLKFLWFVPDGTTKADLVFPNHKPVALAITDKGTSSTPNVSPSDEAVTKSAVSILSSDQFTDKRDSLLSTPHATKLAPSTNVPVWVQIVLDEEFSHSGDVWKGVEELYSILKGFGAVSGQIDNVLSLDKVMGKAGLTVEAFRKRYGEGEVTIPDSGKDKGIIYYSFAIVSFGFKPGDNNFTWLRVREFACEKGIVTTARTRLEKIKTNMQQDCGQQNGGGDGIPPPHR